MVVISLDTEVYIIRHSEGLMKCINNYNCLDSFEIINQKNPLSVQGEEKAKKLSELEELKGIDLVYSSHYVRTIATAKYIADKNNLKINIDYRFGEREFGINNFSELPSDFFEHQLEDWNYKIGNGECLLKVKERMLNALNDALDENCGKRIVIVSHGTSLSALLSKWCDIKINYDSKLAEVYFDNELVFDGNWKAPELFKLIFNKNKELKSIENIKY